MFEGGNMASALNYKNIILYIILICIIAICVMYFLNIANVKPFINGLVSSIKIPNLSSLTDPFNSLFQWIQANPLATTVFGFVGTSAVGYFIKNWQTNKQLNTSIQQLADAKADLSLVKDDATKLADKVLMYEGDTTATQLQKSIDGLKTEYSGILDVKSQEALKLQAQIELLTSNLETERINTLNQLWAKSGGQVLEEAGEKFKVIEKTILNVK